MTSRRRSLTVPFAILSLATAALMGCGSPAPQTGSEAAGTPTAASPQGSQGSEGAKGFGKINLVVFNEGRPGLLTERGVVDVSALTRPLGGHDAMQTIITRYDELKPELTRLAAEGTAQPLSAVTLKAPVPRAKVLAMGGNYREFGARQPEPMWGFLKSTDALLGSGGTVVLPEVDANIFHHEAELVVVFGRAGRNIPQAQALDYVFGYCCGHDFSARELQRRTTQWMVGKAGDGWGPVGPWLVTAEQVDPHALTIECLVNGEVRQSSTTGMLIHDCRKLVSYCSLYMTLKPGDIIFTGTPEGVIAGYPLEKRVWLKAGDRVTTRIEKLGELEFTLT